MINELLSLIIFNVIIITFYLFSFFSISKRLNFIAILITTILWGLIPWPYFYLESEIQSVLMISFTRILISAIFGFIIIIIFITINKFKNKDPRFSWFVYNFQDLKNNLKDQVPTNGDLIKKKKRKWKFGYPLYYFLLGSCYFLSIFFYFLSYQYLGVIFSSIINTVVVMCIVAIWNLIRKTESFDTLKFSYLLILLVSGVLTILSRPLEITATLPGFISLSLTIIFWFLFIVFSGFDKYTKREKKRVMIIKEENNNFQMMKSIVKVSFFFLFALITMFLFITILTVIPLPDNFIKQEIELFYIELFNLGSVFQNPWTWIIGIECTIMPYFIYFLSQNNWPPKSLKFDQWVSILAIFEPLAAIFVGLFIGNETGYNLLLLSSSMMLMIVAMILRYYHEKNSLRSFTLIRTNQKELEDLIQRLKYNSNVIEIKTITGEYDIAIRTFFQSYYKLKEFLDELKQMKSVIEVENHIEFTKK
ncbi:MAG: hypothetical protein GF329_07470 [Candidatus Lokiarchaeota archaeon]|nr:hypothetical protein [Candidatus Lokiarchaeota archaeon]